MPLLPTPYAIDLGDRSVKLLQVIPQRALRERTLRVTCCMNQRIPEGWIANGVIAEPARLAEVIRSLLDRTCGRWRRSPFAVATLPDARTLLTTIALPDAPEHDDLLAQVTPLLPSVLPMNPADATIAVERFPDVAGDLPRMIITAAPAALIASYTSVLAAAGCTPVAVELGAAAGARAVAMRASRHGPPRALLILDLGATRTNAAIALGETVVASTRIDVSGDGLTAAIAAKLRIDAVTAEQLKRRTDCGSARTGSPAAAALAAGLDPLFDGVARTLRFAASHLPPAVQPTAIVLTGGGAELIGLDLSLRAHAHLPVDVFIPPITMTDGRAATIARSPGFAAAFGLALLTLDPVRALSAL